MTSQGSLEICHQPHVYSEDQTPPNYINMTDYHQKCHNSSQIAFIMFDCFKYYYFSFDENKRRILYSGIAAIAVVTFIILAVALTTADKSSTEISVTPGISPLKKWLSKLVKIY